MDTHAEKRRVAEAQPSQPKAPPQEIVSFVPLHSWIKAATRCGFAMDPILREAGVAIDAAGPSDVTITFEQSRKLIETCVARSRGGHFPFVLGEIFGFESFPEIETFLATCSTLRDALQVFDWVRALMSPALRVTLHETGKLAQLRIYMGKGTAWPNPTIYFTEVWLASVLKLTQNLLGQHPIERLLLRHPAPAYVDAYTNFFKTEIKFGQPHDAVVLRREYLDRLLHGASPELHRQAETRIKQRVAKLAGLGGITGQLERNFYGNPMLLSQGIVESALALGLHVRTLQRRLRMEDQNFTELQTRIRFRLASNWLRETALDLEVISERLGFSERRAFTRAFARWSGVSPSAFRRSAARLPP